MLRLSTETYSNKQVSKVFRQLKCLKMDCAGGSAPRPPVEVEWLAVQALLSLNISGLGKAYFY